MIIISLANENEDTNSISIEMGNDTCSLRDVVDLEKVTEFFKGTFVDVEEDLVSFNGLDVAALRNIGGLEVDNDSVLEFTCFGEDSSKVKKEAKVNVYINGNFQFKVVPVCEGRTTVKDLITRELANFFNTEIKEIKKMKAQVNDVEVDNEAFLNDSDEVMFMARKAGTKGAYWNDVDEDEEEYEEEHIDEDNEEQSTKFRARQYNDGDPATVIAYSPGGLTATTVNIEHNVTTVSDVVLSPKILKTNAMTSAQAATLLYCVNDIEVTLDTPLYANDTITMFARRAGTKGSK